MVSILAVVYSDCKLCGCCVGEGYLRSSHRVQLLVANGLRHDDGWRQSLGKWCGWERGEERRLNV
jgi:hypothetical protein